jgi:biotin carboxyl carrier protein
MHGNLDINHQPYEIKAHRQNDSILVSIHGKEFAVQLEETEDGYRVTLGPDSFHVEVTAQQKDHLRLSRPTNISVDGHLVSTVFRPQRQQNLAAPLESQELDVGSVTALMPGTILRVLTQTGQTVKAGDILLILEAMKMENEIKAPMNGIVENILVQEGKAVNKGERLIHLTVAEE